MTRIRTTVTFLFVTLLAHGTAAQSPTDANTQQLIEQLGSKNEQLIKTGVEALTKQGSQVVPALVEALDKRKECQMQFVASGVLRRIDPAHNRIEAALVTLARGDCSGNSKQDFIFKQEAAFALSRTPRGLERLAEMVSDPDLATRRRVAFALEDLTEKFDSPIEQARPQAALVEPTASSQHPSISAAAKAVLEGKRVQCGP